MNVKCSYKCEQMVPFSRLLHHACDLALIAIVGLIGHSKVFRNESLCGPLAVHRRKRAGVVTGRL